VTTTIEKSIDVEVPVSTAYNQWTQFESFPQFMDGVEKIDQVSDTRTHWRTKIAGVTREFDADITEQHRDERVAWRTTDGPHQAGVVTFHRLDDGTTRVMLQMEYDPDTLVEKAGAALGIVQRTVEGDLNRFKAFIESRGGDATGQWRGEVPRSPQAGESYTGQPMPGQQIPGQQIPGQQMPGQRGQTPGQPMPGQPQTGRPQPGDTGYGMPPA
jgi:ribosome-associated toxin RatA of RatAB toxin-antitoxin module